MGRPVIELKEVSKKYYSRLALDNINLTMPRGEVIGLLGFNGAGKSTIIKLIAGIVAPTTGDLFVSNSNGRWPTIGLKPENFVFPDNLKAGQYLTMVARLSNVDRSAIDNVVMQRLAQVNLTAVADKQIKALSPGMLQRLALAQSLIGDPDLVLLDEPFTGIAPEDQDEYQVCLRNLKDENKTIIISSQNLSEIIGTCTYLIILNDGKVHYRSRMADALSLRPYVSIQVDRPLNPSRDLLTMISPNIALENDEVILRENAIGMRRQILSMLINQGFDILKVEQRKATLPEIYNEVRQ